uniref:Lipoyl-binding domain-containing protein n=2 Tax=Brassica oleracea var. oleracea TaxID=109376 RepID=A0A0D3CTM6_BRAOL
MFYSLLGFVVFDPCSLLSAQAAVPVLPNSSFGDLCLGRSAHMIVGCSSPLDSHSIKKNDVSQSSYRKVICVSQLSFNSANPSFLTRTVFSNFQGTTLQRWVRLFSPDSEPGDRVEADEAIAQIETDKVTIDIASPWCDPRVSCQARRYCRTGKQGSYTK